MVKLKLVEGNDADEAATAANGTAPSGDVNHGKIIRALGGKRTECFCATWKIIREDGTWLHLCCQSDITSISNGTSAEERVYLKG